ncbi:MarR family winged helix-turn-helix transcriptional regulator [Ktedonospora formicarum]|uniref:MarR family transcriptional regulator n=1 Tax=Ktedonospora formicarum TaxID=2778364 RepID=A0A8J3HZ59_9CHLR|nr:MarR family transcriptional regulator [Ktedonospora formicarum]GHO45846.1 MarR family transcriptional regulator [Ktedonospora formicarum]
MSRNSMEPSPNDVHVLGTLVATAHILRRYFDARLADQKLSTKLSDSRLRLLLAVEDAGQIRMSDLATSLGIRARTVTALVDALEQEDMLSRLPDPTDRRATLLVLTKAAQAHFQQVRLLQQQLSEDVLASLTADERVQLDLLLKRLQHVLTRKMRAERDEDKK